MKNILTMLAMVVAAVACTSGDGVVVEAEGELSSEVE